jgi:hypothetical protein
MASLSTTSFNLPSHDHNRGDLLPAQHESHESPASREKMDVRLTRSQHNPSAGSSSDRSDKPASALTCYFQLLFQETFPNNGGDLKISFDNAKARRDYRSEGRSSSKKNRIERSLSLISEEDSCPPTAPVPPPAVVSKQISRWETGSPASTFGKKKMSVGRSAAARAFRNTSLPISTMPRQPIRSLMSESSDHRIPPGGLFVGDLMMCDSNEKERGLRMGRKVKMLADAIEQKQLNMITPLEHSISNAAA